MKIKLLLIVIIFVSCNSSRTNSESKILSETKTVSENIAVPDTEIIETFVDSLNIGVKGKNKVELIKHRVLDDVYVLVKFYTKEYDNWYIQNTYSYECTALMDFNTDISDFNNDNFNDITFISANAARGANEVRRLFIYNDYQKKLISIENAQDFPNMRYNKKLNCIDAFLVHGTSTTVFANIVKDSLIEFARVYNDMDYHTVSLVDKNGNENEIKKVKSTGAYVRFKNFDPLEEFDGE